MTTCGMGFFSFSFLFKGFVVACNCKLGSLTLINDGRLAVFRR